MTEKRPMFVQSVDTKKVVEVLLSVPPLGDVTYSEISNSIGRDVSNGARYVLESARRTVFDKEGILFEAIKGVGLHRIDDNGIVSSSDRGIAKIRRASRRECKRITHGVRDFSALPNDLKIKHNTAVSVLGVFEHMTKPTQIKKLEGKVEQAHESLPLAKTLEAFK